MILRWSSLSSGRGQGGRGGADDTMRGEERSAEGTVELFREYAWGGGVV